MKPTGGSCRIKRKEEFVCHIPTLAQYGQWLKNICREDPLYGSFARGCAEMDDTPFISIIIAVYNGARTLQQCIDSVICQTYPNRELVVIDGGSTDGTVDIIRSNESRIAYWESKPDRGIYDAWNKALEHISGDWVCFLGADDFYWDKNVLAHMAPYLSAAKVRVVYAKVALLTENGEILSIIGDPWEKARRTISHFMSVPHTGLMHHRELFTIHGKFNDQFKIAGDYDFLLRELKYNNAYFIPDLITAGMQCGGVSSSQKNMANSLDLLQEFSRARHNNKIRVIPVQWAWVYLKALTRVFLSRVIGENTTRRIADLYRKLIGKNKYWTK